MANPDTGQIAVPQLGTPLVDPINLSVSIPWYRFFIGLFNLAGGSNATPSNAVYILQTGANTYTVYNAATGAVTGTFTVPAGGGHGSPAQVQTLGTSPFVFTATTTGTIIVDANASLFEISRNNGVTYYIIGGPGGAVPVLTGDRVRVTWPGTTPVVVFLPV